MADWTITICDICTNEFLKINKTQFAPYEQKVEVGRKKIFSFDYPFYGGEKEKENFEKEFIRNFWDQEIGYETFALFQMKLENYLLVNYDRLNAIYEAMLKASESPLGNVNITEEHENFFGENSKKETKNKGETQSGRASKGTQSSVTEDSGTSSITYGQRDQTDNQNINSDNPQVNFAGNDYASDMSRSENIVQKSGTDRTQLKNESENGTSYEGSDSIIGNSEENNSENYEHYSSDGGKKTRKGWEGVNPIENLEKMIAVYQAMNQIIFNECESLFMQILFNPESMGGFLW